jgi:dTDP-4-amino-4,6-dideoxygalactose transaminase
MEPSKRRKKMTVTNEDMSEVSHAIQMYAIRLKQEGNETRSNQLERLHDRFLLAMIYSEPIDET